MKYSLEQGSWYLYDERGNLVLKTDELTIGYTEDDCFGTVLHKHGQKDYVLRWAQQMTQAGLDDAHVLFLTKDTPVEEVNKIISTTGYLASFIQRHTVEINPTFQIA